MVQTVHAWLEDADRSATEAGITAVADDLCITSGDNIRLRKDVPKIGLLYGWTEFAAYEISAMRLTAASLGSNHLRITRGSALNYRPNAVYDWRDAPFDRITPGENVTCYGVEDDEAGVAHYLGLAIIVCDKPIPKGPIPKLTHVHRCTAAAATAGTWSQLALTEQDSLPAGEYDMYGARVENALAMAARFVFKDPKYLRPAVIPVTAAADGLHSFSQFWGGGVRFTMPDGLPDLEILAGGTGTSVIEMYLAKVG